MHTQQQTLAVPDRVRHGKIQGRHVDRLAVVYVRQSTLRQVQEHQESTRLQYGLQDRAIQLGWAPQRVIVIDEDQGHSGKSVEGRAGFQRLVAEVGLNHVGLILGIELSRLARSNSDWYQLLDMCALFHTLIADVDGIYDPRTSNDRLLLGLKGTMAEAELHLLKQRLNAGRWAKARRGDLWIPLPMGYVRRPSGEVIKDPDEQAQTVITLVFTLFERFRSVNGVLRYLAQHRMQLPIRERWGPDRGTLRWVRPARPTLSSVLQHPIYAGAYVYGHRSMAQTAEAGSRDPAQVVPLEEEWEVCLPDRLPAYISWSEYVRNVRQIRANCPQEGGVPRQGPSVLAGLVVCGRCGLRMLTRYSQNGHGLCSVCDRRHRQYQEARCQSLSGRPVDEAVSRLVLESLAPLTLDLSLAVTEDLEAERRRLLTYWEQRLERARYEVERASRQYHAVEPEHRLVARQLERQWEAALQAEAALALEYDRLVVEQPVPLTAKERESIRQLASDIPAVWHASTTTAADRQAVVRHLIDRVVVTLEGTSERIAVEVEWAGGHRTTLTVLRPVNSLTQLSTYHALLRRAMALRAEGQTFQAIADLLTTEGWRSANGDGSWTMPMVWNLLDRPEARQRKSKHLTEGMLREPDEWTTHELAETLGMSRYSVYTWLKADRLRARQVWYRGRSRWLIWADEAELNRLRDLREHPPYGSSRPLIEDETPAR